MQYNLVFHEAISRDYEDAFAWYEDRQPGLGEQFLAATRKRLEDICLHPESFSEGVKKGYCEALIDTFPFIVVYRIYKSRHEIFITAIHHERKHPSKKFRR